MYKFKNNGEYPRIQYKKMGGESIPMNAIDQAIQDPDVLKKYLDECVGLVVTIERQKREIERRNYANTVYNFIQECSLGAGIMEEYDIIRFVGIYGLEHLVKYHFIERVDTHDERRLYKLLEEYECTRARLRTGSYF